MKKIQQKGLKLLYQEFTKVVKTNTKSAIRIGYPCINWSLHPQHRNKSFRLSSFNEERFLETVENNLQTLDKIVDFNIKHDLKFLRISSDTIPFASHEVCKIEWHKKFKNLFDKIGKKLNDNEFRVSMHPGQFTLLNSKNEVTVQRSVNELVYHAIFLDALHLDRTAKIQIHVGGIYGDKDSAIERFVKVYKNQLPKKVLDRLVIENDDYHYTVKDCLKIHKQTKIPIIFDNLHHECLNEGETLLEAFNLIKPTWGGVHGIPMLDYSSQWPGEKIGKHAPTVDLDHFENYYKTLEKFDWDAMFEIKDKEQSVLRAQIVINNLHSKIKSKVKGAQDKVKTYIKNKTKRKPKKSVSKTKKTAQTKKKVIKFYG